MFSSECQEHVQQSECVKRTHALAAQCCFTESGVSAQTLTSTKTLTRTLTRCPYTTSLLLQGRTAHHKLPCSSKSQIPCWVNQAGFCSSQSISSSFYSHKRQTTRERAPHNICAVRRLHPHSHSFTYTLPIKTRACFCCQVPKSRMHIHHSCAHGSACLRHCERCMEL